MDRGRELEAVAIVRRQGKLHFKEIGMVATMLRRFKPGQKRAREETTQIHVVVPVEISRELLMRSWKASGRR